MNNLTLVKEFLEQPSYKISESLGKGRGAFSDWERGISSPRFDSLVKFQEIYGISPDFILFGVGSITTKGEFNFDFSNRLKYERITNGVSQKSFAELLGVSRQYYNYIEMGRMSPSKEFLTQLNELTGKSVSYFIGGQQIEKETCEV